MKTNKVFNIAVNIFFIIISIVSLVPFLVIISVSISSEVDINRYGFSLLPRTIDLSAYDFLLRDLGGFGHSVVYTLMIAIFAPVVSLALQALIAYPLSRPNYKYRGIINKIIVFTMLFNAGLIPNYIFTTKYYHLGNNTLLFFIGGSVTAWGIILFRTFFKGIPSELYEAGFIDGASDMQTFRHIVLPMSKPIFGIQYFLAFVGKWNDFQTSLMYMTDPNKFTIQHYMQRILDDADRIKQAYAMIGIQQNVDVPVMTMRYAMCLISIIPVLVVFPKMQKHFSKGISAGSVKG